MKTTAWLSAMILATFLLALAQGAAATPQVVQASTPIPTLTGTAIGPYILVPDQVNVRMCPSTDCDLVGVLIAGQEAPAIGRSSGGDWIQIIYQGVPGNIAWVYSPFVVLEAGPSLLPIIEPPPTPTPRITATIDPTLAAQFNLTAPIATHLPTYTPAPQVIYPTFEPEGNGNGSGFPPIIAIITLMVVGMSGLVISVLRGSGTRL